MLPMLPGPLIRRSARQLLVIGLAWLALFACPGARVSGADPAAAPVIFLPLVARDYPPSFATQVVTLTNQERANAGCAPLSVNPILTAIAQAHSLDMAINDFFNHVNRQGKDPFDRMADAGYQFSNAAENIAAGYSTPASVMAGWMGSTGHRGNILNCNLTEIGIGYYYLANDTGAVNYHHYWTQDFGRP